MIALTTSFASQGSPCRRKKESCSFNFKYLLLSSELCSSPTSIYHTEPVLKFSMNVTRRKAVCKKLAKVPQRGRPS